MTYQTPLKGKTKKKLWFYLFFYGMFLYVNCITLILLTIILGCICWPGTACCSVTSVFVSIATTTYFYSMQQQIYHTHIPCRLVADVGHLVPSLSCPLSVCSIEETELLCLFLSPTPKSICWGTRSYSQSLYIYPLFALPFETQLHI
jgi:hypothetical protein